jgi:hypothetical protein
MSSSAQCDECEAILEEIRNAFAELHLSPKLSAELRDDCEVFLRTFSGTEQDLEEGLGKLQFRSQSSASLRAPESRYPKIAVALRKMSEHRFRTGHNALFRK